jgi:Type ISP C-terminal specificity domain
MPIPTPSRAEIERLRAIRSFPQLLKYLREELDWPIEIDDVEDLTFEYSPEELGLDAKTAIKIRHIRQLRPLASSQPWGIFFVEFEPKKLPVVVLRRVLQRLVIDRRGRAKKAELQAWQRHDLLFISSFGENEERSLTFAHFADAPSGHQDDLPTLKVLGWDADDTVLHLDKVHRDLKEHLRWPTDERRVDEWRHKWGGAFTLSHRYVITTAQDLALRLAELAVQIRVKANQVLRVESSTGPLRKLQKAFQQALIHDLTDDGFADLYAQTISYGLLSARIMEGPKATADSLADRIPITNPFLKELLQSFLKAGGRAGRSGKGGIDFDELGVSDIVDLLNSPTTNMEAVLRDFGNKTRGEDPVIHFYEHFLSAYNKAEKIRRGVFYTPQPAVSYIIRSVHEVLKKEFGLEDGLASTVTWREMVAKHGGLTIPSGVNPDSDFIQVLDPATGTGTFLVEAIDVIYATLVARWQREGKSEAQSKQLWDQYVPAHLLPRLHGYELMPAPYAIAHMKIGLKLHETGYGFGSEERVRVYLTNALEAPHDLAGRFEFDVPALEHEAQAVNTIKRTQKFTVAVGNPPYSNMSANLAPDARALVARLRQVDGVPLDERNRLQLERNINDDYVKFLVKIEDLLSTQDACVACLITNRSYLDARTLRGLRASLLNSFGRLQIADLGGASSSPGSSDNSEDGNVFEIEQPVGIILAARCLRPTSRSDAASYVRVLGNRAQKYDWLLAHTASSACDVPVRPSANLFLLTPFSAEDGWDCFVPIDQCLDVFAEGLKTGCDDLLVGFTRDSLRAQLRDLADQSLRPAELRERYTIGKEGWGNDLLNDRQKTGRLVGETRTLTSFPYRPLDFRYAMWGSGLLKASSRVAGRHLMERQPNCALIVARQVDGPDVVSHFAVSRTVPDNRIFYSKKGSASYFPIWRAEGGSHFSLRWTKLLSAALGRAWDETDGENAACPGKSTEYCYAVFHSPQYRSKYLGSLKREFPRIPIPRAWAVFNQLALLGRSLIALHLFESPVLEQSKLTQVGSNRGEIDTVSWDLDTVWIDKTQTRGFRGVPEVVWNFHIGGYQVCEKWLKDRKGRTLSKDDIEHYQKIVVAIGETIRIMAEIDKVIDAHGGWPGAFVTREQAEKPRE